MGPVRLGVGTQWLLDGRAWRVVRQLSPDRFIALDAKFNREEEFSRQQILNDYAEGRLQFAAVDVPVSLRAELAANNLRPRRMQVRCWPRRWAKRPDGRRSVSTSANSARPRPSR